MKKIKILVLAIPFFFLSCSSDSDSDTQNQEPAPTYAMTAKINNVDFAANNPFGTNLFSNTNIWSYYPLADYVMIQGRQGGALGTPEIDIWLRRTQIAVGTYPVTTDTTNPTTHAIDLVDLSNGSVYENTVAGTITITEVNTSTKIVKGTFQFTTSDNANATSPVINYTVTNGTFNYKYEN